MTAPASLVGTNPTGKGLQWVKALWVDRKYPKELENLKHEFCYVPALLQDNPHLGVSYKESLMGLPEKKRRALLDGDWSIPEGQYFTNFEMSDRRVHPSIVKQIVKPWWNHWISQDWGFKHHTPVHWHAVGNVTVEQGKLLGRDWVVPKQCVFTYREHIESLGESGRSEQQLGADIRLKSLGEPIKSWILSSDAFGEKTSQNTAAMLLGTGADSGHRPEYFPNPTPANMGPGSRVVGWRFMYQLIQNDSWFLSEMCPDALAAIPSLEYDSDKGGEDVLKTDHLYDDIGDELRYGLQDMLNSAAKPRELQLAEEIALVEKRDPLEAHFMRLRETEDRKKRREPLPYWE